MRALVVSNILSRRTTYFIKAGAYAGVDTRFITYDTLEKELPAYEDVLIKLEPPVYQESGFREYHALCKEYIRLLERIGRIKKKENVCFLNNPRAIISSLDKVESKKRLSGLRTTPLLSSSITSFEALTDLLENTACGRVFIKPRLGSGAGGIMALRYNKQKGAFAAYTTLAKDGSFIYNTKRINRLINPAEIAFLANAVFDVGALVEEWMIKDTLEGENYDLRVVSLRGEVVYIVVRCSKGAITNLHLNNKARLFNDLKMPRSIKEEIESACIRATELSGLQYAGIDILVERDTKLPYIIEVNGQGDHIYQDMYNANSIYVKQINHYETRYRTERYTDDML